MSIDKAPAAGRPRDPRIDAAILAATADLLVEIGYSNLTMAAVAERAGTTKTALYRRWSSKAELVHEAAFPDRADGARPRPRATSSADVRAMIAAARDVFTSPVVRAALPGLIADMAADAELNARVMSRFIGLFGVVRDRLGARASRAARCTPTSTPSGSSRSSAARRCCGCCCPTPSWTTLGRQTRRSWSRRTAIVAPPYIDHRIMARCRHRPDPLPLTACTCS